MHHPLHNLPQSFRRALAGVDSFVVAAYVTIAFVFAIVFTYGPDLDRIAFPISAVTGYLLGCYAHDRRG